MFSHLLAIPEREESEKMRDPGKEVGSNRERN